MRGAPNPESSEGEGVFGVEDQCFSVYFLMGGWEDLFKAGQATPPIPCLRFPICKL